jgi:tRNA dimethylallyltransferase
MERTVTRTRQLAKRQRTWFRHQARVEWVDVKDGDPVDSIAERVQELWGKYGSARLA